MPNWLNFTVTRKGRYTTITLGRLRLRLHTVSREWQDLINEADARQAQTPIVGPSPWTPRPCVAPLSPKRDRIPDGFTSLAGARDHGKTLGWLSFRS
jgi:hypothetical protein